MNQQQISIIQKETYAEIDIMRGSEKIGFAEVSGTELCRFNIFEPFQNKGYGQEALKQLIEKSSAQPKIIRCKDCKHRYVDGDNVRFNVCELNHNKVQSDNWYCADAERKER